jgi:hypothetical protein
MGVAGTRQETWPRHGLAALNPRREQGRRHGATAPPPGQASTQKDASGLRKIRPRLWVGPPEVFDYRLGNRSALEWVIDQYHVSEDARSGIRSDPNRADAPEYIVRLVGQVVRVSVEAVKIVAGLAEVFTA